MPTQPYRIEYDNFMLHYQSGITNAEQIGLLISHLAQYFSDANEIRSNAEKSYNKVIFQSEQNTDMNGKPISSAKAQAVANASDEYDRVIESRMHLENIEQMINSSKSLQKGVLNEYSHMGNA